MIERHQTHQVDYAQSTDLDAVEQLYLEAQRFTTRCGTPYVKPRSRAELERLLPSTLLLEHRDVIIGMLHATEVPDAEGAVDRRIRDRRKPPGFAAWPVAALRSVEPIPRARLFGGGGNHRVGSRQAALRSQRRPARAGSALAEAAPRGRRSPLPPRRTRPGAALPVRSADGKRRVTTAAPSLHAGERGSSRGSGRPSHSPARQALHMIMEDFFLSGKKGTNHGTSADPHALCALGGGRRVDGCLRHARSRSRQGDSGPGKSRLTAGSNPARPPRPAASAQLRRPDRG